MLSMLPDGNQALVGKVVINENARVKYLAHENVFIGNKMPLD